MSSTVPVTLTNNRVTIDRLYQEAGAFQWARETVVNALEARATRIYFGVEPHGLKNSRVSRRYIADNGRGMDESELVELFGALGGSGKNVGGAHENFGVGAKISLLPWNRAGLLVCSWKDGVGSMIWLKADEDTGEYGLQQVVHEGVNTTAWPAELVSELGLGVQHLKPEWIDDHGTVLLLLGNDLGESTYYSAERDESGHNKLRQYLNERFWLLPDHCEVFVEEHDKDKLTVRQVKGAKHQLSQMRDPISGKMELQSGASVSWFYDINREARASDSWSHKRGYMAAKYRDELYEVERRIHRYNDFGITSAEVRSRLFVIVEPRVSDANRRNGAFPKGDRFSLLWADGSGNNTSLPWSDWAEEFFERMPEVLKDELRKDQAGGTISDDRYKKKFAHMMDANRFRLSRRKVAIGGDTSVDPDLGRRTQNGTSRGKRIVLNANKPSTGNRKGSQAATESDVIGGIPSWRPCKAADIGAQWIAEWHPRDIHGPTVALNIEHPAIVNQVEHWVSQYAKRYSTAVESAVHEVYGESLVAKICHSEGLSRDAGVVKQDLDLKYRSKEALTMACLGLINEDAAIQQRINLPKSRSATGEAE